jgi:hypothetical protein
MMAISRSGSITSLLSERFQAFSKVALGTLALTLSIQTISQAQHSAPVLTCPNGTTTDREESSSTRIVCDVDSDENPDPETDIDVYPYPDTEPHIVHESELPPLVNRNYPDWYRGRVISFSS